MDYALVTLLRRKENPTDKSFRSELIIVVASGLTHATSDCKRERGKNNNIDDDDDDDNINKINSRHIVSTFLRHHATMPGLNTEMS